MKIISSKSLKIRENLAPEEQERANPTRSCRLKAGQKWYQSRLYKKKVTGNHKPRWFMPQITDRLPLAFMAQDEQIYKLLDFSKNHFRMEVLAPDLQEVVRAALLNEAISITNRWELLGTENEQLFYWNYAIDKLNPAWSFQIFQTLQTPGGKYAVHMIGVSCYATNLIKNRMGANGWFADDDLQAITVYRKCDEQYSKSLNFLIENDLVVKRQVDPTIMDNPDEYHLEDMPIAGSANLGLDRIVQDLLNKLSIRNGGTGGNRRPIIDITNVNWAEEFKSILLPNHD